ncbi:ABC transporter substrate-binding protein [Pelagovum pacificum]|nr:extracellular solute-binding protein [Pelagovum pacificum]QQA41455.1 extracellular solute-binding protein [Pelagovum pacificum]
MSKLTTYTAAIALCMGLATPAFAQTTLTYMAIGPERTAFNEEIIRRFEEEHPDINVEFRWLANEPYKTGIKVVMESDSPPDVFFIWAGTWAQDFVDAGAVADLSESEANGDLWTVGMPKALVDQFRDENGLWGVPSELYVKEFWRNDAFFAEHDLTMPETFEGLLNMCSEVREIDPQMTPIAFGASESWTINHYLTTLFQRHVAPDVSARDYRLQGNPEELFTDPGYLKALQDFKRLQEADCFNDGINSVSPEVSRAMFGSGLAATTYCGSWCPPQFDAAGMNGGYTPFRFPAIEGASGVQQGSMAGASGYQVSNASEYPEAAMTFLNYIANAESQVLMTELTGLLPANGTQVPEGGLSEANSALLDIVAEDEATVAALNTVVETSVSDVILKSGQDLVAGTVTPDEFMERVREAAQTAAAR